MASLRAICRGPRFETDKGYAWVILFLSTLSHFVHLGFYTGIVGNLTIMHQKYFDIDLQLGSLIGAVHGGTLLMFGPVASILVKKLGCRVSEISGGVCMVLGVGLSYFSTEPWHAFLLYSVLSAVGIPILYVASSEILVLSFARLKYLAFAIAVLGEYGGKAALATVSQKLFEAFGYSKAMAIMSSFHIIHIIAGILFFQPTEKKYSDDAVVSISTKPPPTQKTIESAEVVRKDESELQIISYANVIDDDKKERITDENREQHVDEEAELVDQKLQQVDADSGSLKLKLTRLLKQQKVWAFLVSAALWNCNLTTVLVLINDYMVGYIQITAAEAAIGVTIIGIANLLGCVFVSVIGLVKFDRVILHLFSTARMGVFTIAIAFSANKMMYYGIAALFGLAQGALLANLLGVVNDLVEDISALALLLGLELFGEGVGALSGTSLCSYVSESVGAQYGIILAGCAGITSSLCILPVLVHRMLNRRKQNSELDDNNSETTDTML